MAGNHSVLIVVFDGLQPAQITPELMPNLAEFAQTGVTLTNHHPVFPTVTRVNVSSLVTGCLPGKHGWRETLSYAETTTQIWLSPRWNRCCKPFLMLRAARCLFQHWPMFSTNTKWNT